MDMKPLKEIFCGVSSRMRSRRFYRLVSSNINTNLTLTAGPQKPREAYKDLNQRAYYFDKILRLPIVDMNMVVVVDFKMPNDEEIKIKFPGWEDYILVPDRNFSQFIFDSIEYEIFSILKKSPQNIDKKDGYYVVYAEKHAEPFPFSLLPYLQPYFKISMNVIEMNDNYLSLPLEFSKKIFLKLQKYRQAFQTPQKTVNG
jgi:hypothetical protein